MEAADILVYKKLKELVYKKLKEGDSRCSIEIGANIIKVLSEPGDVHPVGTQGKVIGNMAMDVEGELKEAYLVDFNDAGALSFIIRKKIEKL